MIIVTSVGRAGTSAYMEWLKEAGINVGDIAYVPGYDAGNEHPKATQINAQFRKAALSGKDLSKEMDMWNQYQAISELQIQAIKDPQFLAYPDIIRHWINVRKDIKVVWLRRAPEEVVLSQRRVQGMTTPAYRCFPDLIREHEEQFERTLKELEVEYIEHWFPHFMNERSTVRKVLKELKGTRGKKIKDNEYNEAWDRVFEPTMVHIHSEPEFQIEERVVDIDIPKSEAVNVENAVDLIMGAAIKAEEGVVNEVLKQIGVEPGIEAYKKITRLFRQGINHQYTLAYDGTTLGTMHLNYMNQNYAFELDRTSMNQSVTFEPLKEFQS